jgi:hypothetical protein
MPPQSPIVQEIPMQSGYQIQRLFCPSLIQIQAESSMKQPFRMELQYANDNSFQWLEFVSETGGNEVENDSKSGGSCSDFAGSMCGVQVQ